MRQWARTFVASFRVFSRDAPSTFWLVLALVVLDSLGYFLTTLNLTLLLSDEFGADDTTAGWVYSARGVAASLAFALAGPFIDRLDVAASLVVGAVLTLVGRIVLASARSLAVAEFAAVGMQAFAGAFTSPVHSICIRRLVHARHHPLAYGLSYSLMNVGALLAGAGTDWLLAHGGMRAVYMAAAIVGGVYALLVAVTWHRLSTSADADAALIGGGGGDERELADTAAKSSALERVRATCSDRRAWLVVGFMTALFWARTPFMHLDATFPKYAERVFGGRLDYGTVYAINPALIIVGVPIVQSLVGERDPYTLIVVGTAFVAVAPLFVVAAADSVAGIVGFMLVLSVGEALYSPTVSVYIMALAPRGREGVYGTLSTAPMVLGTIIVGAVSGRLLATNCPPPTADDALADHGTYARTCARLWLVVAALAAITPLSLVAARRHLYPPDVEREVCRARRPDIGTFDEDDEDVVVIVGGGDRASSAERCKAVY